MISSQCRVAVATCASESGELRHPHASQFSWVRYGSNNFGQNEGTEVKDCNHLGSGEYSPEKAGVGGSTPSLATMFSRSDPETWFTECTGHMGNTFGPNGFSRGSKTLLSKSK